MNVLLVVIDGASPRVVCPAVQIGRLPNLRRLADAGGMHQAATTIFPSITPAATATIVTGAYPAEHGIAGAAWYEQARDEIAYYGDDFWVIARRGFGRFLDDFLVRLNGDRLLAPTLFELIERTGRRAASLNYLIYRGLATHQVYVPWPVALLPSVERTRVVEGPAMLHLGDFVSARPSRRGRLDARSGILHRFGMDDAATAELLVELAGRGMPDFTVAYFADNDFTSHAVGPHASLRVVDRVDAALGAMLDAAGGFDRFVRDTCVVVTSDHGHCDILGDREAAAIDLQAALGGFRQAVPGRRRRSGDDLLICPNMRSAQIYLREPEAMTERVARAALRDPRVDLALWRTVAAGRPREYTVLGQSGRLTFWRDREGPCDAYGGGWRWEGDAGVLRLEPDGPRVDSPEYPNPFERICGALDARRSGDLWVTARPGCEFEMPGGAAHVGGGSHGALHALDSFVPVITAGAARPLPRAMRSLDIAPFCMDALGVRMRYRVGEPR